MNTPSPLDGKGPQKEFNDRIVNQMRESLDASSKLVYSPNGLDAYVEEKVKEFDALFERKFFENRYLGGKPNRTRTRIYIKNLLTSTIERTTEENVKKFKPFDFVEPCEPDCSPERHAYHKGQWDMAVRIEEFISTLKQEK